ncbi:unnamed protein product [Danaus chrysippus]|uniref:(African queen) hypothetical protein n=1 Tax=Danaus chrysippus TaxID=151541 RepID=A0A8J2VTE4_9NEOP|nr:unnamed protein product [Danaus chrysippus]
MNELPFVIIISTSPYLLCHHHCVYLAARLYRRRWSAARPIPVPLWRTETDRDGATLALTQYLDTDLVTMERKKKQLYQKQLIPETAFAPSVLTEAPAPDDHQENVPALDYPRAQTPECGNTTPTFLSEASTPDLDQENVPPIDSQQRKTPESSDRSPSILTQIPISDVLRGNISPVDCLR